MLKRPHHPGANVLDTTRTDTAIESIDVTMVQMP